MRPITRNFVTALFFTVMAGATSQAQTATIDYDHSVDFAKFKTFTWAKVHATDPGVEQGITIAVNRTMGGRYMTEKPKDGDVTIVAVEATRDKQEYADFYASLQDFPWQRSWGSAGFLDAQAGLEDVAVNTLVIDMYDTRSHKLLWRGSMTLSDADAHDKEADQKIDKAVTGLISKYPPKFKK